MASVIPSAPGHMPALTSAQARIAHAPQTMRQLVTAGAGTGKTYTLVQRVSFLVNEESLSPGSEVLLLTFSRAAAREIRERLRLTEGRSRYVHVATFDSFSTRLLSTLAPDGEWLGAGYDGRIEAATRMITSRTTEALEFLRAFRHILIDELQDLVGLRSELVKELLVNTEGGWTLFGDPAQAIYSFQVPLPQRANSTGSFIRWLREVFAGRFESLELEGNFRALTNAARTALPVGALLSEPSPDFDQAYAQLRHALGNCRSVQALPDNAPVIAALRRGDASTAFLCRNNGQALVLSERIRQLGLQHWVRGQATDRALAPWVASVVAQFATSSVSKRTFLAACEDLDIDAESSWALMKKAEGERTPNQLNLRSLAARMRNGSVPDEMNVLPSHRLTISTIHRVKGLEYDRVIVIEPSVDDDVDEDGGFQDEVRLLYVAMTRAKSEILHMNGLKLFFVRRSPTGRWYRSGDQPWKRLGIEVRPEDVEHLYPADSESGDALEAQHYIRTQVSAGDEVELRKRVSIIDGQPRVQYEIVHGQHAVGSTNQNFILELLAMYGRKPPQWPDIITNVFVEGIDSVAGADGAAQKSGVGWCDIWLRVRVCGLGKFSYGKR